MNRSLIFSLILLSGIISGMGSNHPINRMPTLRGIVIPISARRILHPQNATLNLNDPEDDPMEIDVELTQANKVRFMPLPVENAPRRMHTGDRPLINRRLTYSDAPPTDASTNTTH